MTARTSSVLQSLAFARPSVSFAQSTLSRNARRNFQTSRIMMADSVVSSRKPVGAFRGSLFGFLLGTVLAGSGLYYYVIDEYKVSNQLLVEDIYALQSAVSRLEGYVKSVEESVQNKK